MNFETKFSVRDIVKQKFDHPREITKIVIEYNSDNIKYKLDGLENLLMENVLILVCERENRGDWEDIKC